MSENVIELPGLMVTQYAGPAVPGQDRRLYQLTQLDGPGLIVLTRDQLDALALALGVYVGGVECPNTDHLDQLRKHGGCPTCHLITD